MKRTAFLLWAGLAAGTAHSMDPPSGCGKLAEIPVPGVEFSASKRPPLRRLHSLFELFSAGDGRLAANVGRTEPRTAPGVALHPLPWHAAPDRSAHLRLVLWGSPGRGNDENMPVILLRPGESWCTSSLELPPGARVRLEPVSTEPASGRLGVAIEGGPSLFEAPVAPPASLDASRQVDLELPPGRSSLCFRASKASVAIGEPRILVPEEASRDPRPRWIVLTIVDGLRGDLLRRDEASELVPRLSRLRDEGRHYRNAIAPGCHTRASVWPILMGRDLMRIDRMQRRRTLPILSPLETIYSRANLFVSHLADSAGYHPVFLGNNAYLRAIPAFSRYSSWGQVDRGTVDTLERLPELFSRYQDERIFLLYYVSATHLLSEIPRRLYRELGCAELPGTEERCRCGYDARAIHADEALEALARGLRAHGLDQESLQILTADHGELFGEGMELEGEIPSFGMGEQREAFQSFAHGHGNACHPLESDVPLLVHGKNVRPGRWDGAVSGLDVVPTLLSILDLAPPGKLDGLPLPLSAGPQVAPLSRPMVSYGFCSDSRLEDGEQLIWWVEGCRLRDPEGREVDHRAELWAGGRRLGTDQTAPRRLHELMDRHEKWLLERLPAEAFVFGASGLDRATIRIAVENGRIVDYGPASTVHGLSGVRVLGLAPDGSEILVRLEGYRGLYHVSTLPPRAKVRIEVEERPDVLTFVGPMQLPLPVSATAVDPATDERFLFSARPPAARSSAGPALRLWWQSYGSGDSGASSRELSDFDRVLREWGYIR